MLVNEVKQYKAKIEGIEEEVTFRLDFKALIKMHKEYGNAFILIYALTSNNDLSVLPKIVRCMADVELTEEQIINSFEINHQNVTMLAGITNDLINKELMSDSEFKEEQFDELLKKTLDKVKEKKD